MSLSGREEALDDFNDATRTSEQIAQDNEQARKDWQEQLDQAAGKYLWVECEDDDGEGCCSVKIGFTNEIPTGEEAVLAAVQAARQAFETAMREAGERTAYRNMTRKQIDEARAKRQDAAWDDLGNTLREGA